MKSGKRQKQILKRVQNDTAGCLPLADEDARRAGEGAAVNSEFYVLPSALLRIIDANLNRCREGLRVVEDCLRYVLDDGILYKNIRRIRHNADKVLRDNYASLIQERDSIKDSGREMPETAKKELSGIIAANFKRAQESLRVLEEYSKTVFPKASAEFKRQRYAVYNLEKTVFLKHKNFFSRRKK